MGNVSSGRDEDSSVANLYSSSAGNSPTSSSGGRRKPSRIGRTNFLIGTNQVAVTTMTNSTQVADTPRSDISTNTINSARGGNSPITIGTQTLNYQHHHHYHSSSLTSSIGGTS